MEQGLVDLSIEPATEIIIDKTPYKGNVSVSEEIAVQLIKTGKAMVIISKEDTDAAGNE